MNKWHYELFFFCVLILMGMCGCGNSSKKPEVKYPLLSEIPPIPLYSDVSNNWKTEAVCWLGVAEDAKWNGTTSEYAGTQLRTALLPIMKETLIKQGYRVETFENDYITREKRLSIHRIILLQDLEVKRTLVHEGICYDVKVGIAVISNQNPEKSDLFDAWSRSVLKPNESRPWPELYILSIENLFKILEFRQSLELS